MKASEGASTERSGKTRPLVYLGAAGLALALWHPAAAERVDPTEPVAESVTIPVPVETTLPPPSTVVAPPSGTQVTIPADPAGPNDVVTPTTVPDTATVATAPATLAPE